MRNNGTNIFLEKTDFWKISGFDHAHKIAPHSAKHFKLTLSFYFLEILLFFVVEMKIKMTCRFFAGN